MQNAAVQDSAVALLEWYLAMGVETIIEHAPQCYFTPLLHATPTPDPLPAITTPAVPLMLAPSLLEEARTLAEKATDIPTLHRLMHDMDLCPLKRTALRSVQGWGNPHAPLLMIGDIPDSADEMAGQYLSGEAGALLENILHALGKTKEACYALPLLWWRPPAGRQPTSEEASSCVPFIQQQIALQRPTTLLITSGLAAQLLLGKSGSLAQLRQEAWEYIPLHPLHSPIPTIVSFSMAHLLKQPSLKKIAWQDFLRLC